VSMKIQAMVEDCSQTDRYISLELVIGQNSFVMETLGKHDIIFYRKKESNLKINVIRNTTSFLSVQ
jgi:hypothetical protein